MAAILAAACGQAAAQGARPGAIKLAGHRAAYDLTLARADAGGGVVALRGRLALEFTDVCDGFTLAQRIHTEMDSADGDTVRSDFTVVSWESRDGRTYRFNLKHELGGQIAEAFSGRAEVLEGGGAGQVAFTKPENRSLELPPGTVWPTEHLAQIIAGAIEGKQFVPALVFDGSFDDGVYNVSSVISQREAVRTGNPLLVPLDGMRSWAVRLAYFPTEKAEARPQYEIGFRLFQNGVSDELILDYGDFAMKGEIRSLELLPDPGC